MAVIQITLEKQFDELLNSNSKVAVDFFAEWCGPCKVISPIFELLSTQFPEIVFLSVDVDKVEAVAQKYGIRAMPTFIMFKDGEKALVFLPVFVATGWVWPHQDRLHLGYVDGNTRTLETEIFGSFT
ncbi:hypothetical protein XA68_14693 [Ophiocordyceps unilateralis]|uniref:Thioredoxin domain-containing protein n=1 Tax=Ophiocordyceps unilateralis TaxID=268505 RepID=A0A2A9P9W7_OPHUN|nr:hypothetical protein XA68_14693 [Ophiocordyceps unilateralis]